MSETDKQSVTVDQLILDGPLAREYSLKEAFGEDKFATILELEESTLKLELDHYNYKVKQLAPLYKKRSELLKSIPGLWLQAITNCGQLSDFVDPIDHDALEHLEDLTIEHDPEDPRNVTFHFHWSKNNPYFSDRILSKAFTVAIEEPATNGDASHATESALYKLYSKYSLDCDLTSAVVPINWSSKDHDLVAKKPFVNVTELEEFLDDDTPRGSFFNLFAATDDRCMMHAILLELHSKVLDFYAGCHEEEDEEIHSEDEEDEDPTKVVDLEDNSDEGDLPKRKRVKVATN